MRVIPLVLALSAMSGCYLGDAPPDPLANVGPAPLRRLTNGEYKNVLHDLFPTQAPTLPPLPNDTIIAGFDNDVEAQQPSDVAIARYEAIANLYAAGATTDSASVRVLTGCDDWSTPTLASACAAKFIAQEGLRIYRRPLTSDESMRLETKLTAWQSAIDFEAAVRLTLSAMLQSPQFIYRPEPVVLGTGVVAVDPYMMASRLSFFLWESAPDDVLLDAASKNALATGDQIRAQAERMLDDDRARRALWSFHRQWLGLDRILTDEQTYRTPDIDPNWTAQTPVSAEMETELFVENTMMGHGTLSDLLLSPHAWVNGDMARIYGVTPPDGPSTFGAIAVTLPSDQRAGVLTRVAFLGGTSHRGGTSPPIRGNAVAMRLLCRMPISPPPGVDLSMPTAPPNSGPQTTRMLFEARTSPATCQSCHAGLNGIGFGFEHYDAAGAYRTTEATLPIDATGMLLGTDADGPFDGALALSSALAHSADVHRCATEQWLRYALGRAPDPEELPLLDAWTNAFVASGGDVRALLVSIVTSPTFRFRRAGG